MSNISSFHERSRPLGTLKRLPPSKDAEKIYVYIMGNETNGKLAVSMTQDLDARVRRQKDDLHRRDFTSVNAIHTLVHAEEYSDVCEAIDRYDSLRNMAKDNLSWFIEQQNPAWRDLFEPISDESAQKQG